MNKVLFVCLGNICRSPAAEAVFKKLVNDRGLSDQFMIDSAATCANHIGEMADARMRAEASNRNINITSRGRQFEVADFEKFDRIIVMDDSNYSNVMKLNPNKKYEAKVSKMTDYCSEKFSEHTVVPDPYYGGQDGFILVLDLLEDASQKLLSSMA